MVTIKDIAKRSGVSVATVSRVINNKSDVSDEMRKYIMKIMDDMAYVPNTIAKNLSHGRSNLMAVMLPTLNTPFFSDLLSEIETQADKHGYKILLLNSSDDRNKAEFYLNYMRSNFVCGAIINSVVVTKEDISLLEKSGIRTITFDRTPDDHRSSSIRGRHRLGGQIATRHLVEIGCKNLLMISGPRDDRVTHERMLGFTDAVNEQSGMTAMVVNSDLTSPGGYAAMHEFLNTGQLCDGLFCANDAMAFGAIRACADFGLRVPEDVAVIGYDNSSMSGFYLPAVSSVDQCLKEVGRLSVETLVSLLKSGSKSVHLTVSPELVIRESTQR